MTFLRLKEIGSSLELRAAGLTLSLVKGLIFQLLNYNTISQEKDILFANNLVLKGIASIPISVFYKNKPTDIICDSVLQNLIN